MYATFFRFVNEVRSVVTVSDRLPFRLVRLEIEKSIIDRRSEIRRRGRMNLGS